MGVSVYLDKRHKNSKSGKFPIKYNVTVPGKRSFMINTKIKVSPEYWDGSKIVRHKLKDIINRKLRTEITAIEDAIFRLQVTEGFDFTDITLKAKICALIGQEEYEEKGVTVKEMFEKFINLKEKKNTKDIYNHTLSKITEFAGDEITINQINVSWLESFELFMKNQHLDSEGNVKPSVRKLSVNGINLHFRNLRTVYNYAIKKDIIPQSMYPFKKFTLRNEKTSHRDLSPEEIRLIRDMEVEPHQEYYRDIFMLIFYLAGINISDLCDLKEENLRNGRIEYQRNKTSAFYSIKVEPEAAEIIKKYRGKNYLINPLDKYCKHEDFTKKLNKNLKQLGPVEIGKRGKKTRKPIFPFITTYYARHSLATIAANDVGISEDIIGQILGHSDKSVTKIYINRNTKRMDEAMREILDYIK